MFYFQNSIKISIIFKCSIQNHGIFPDLHYFECHCLIYKLIIKINVLFTKINRDHPHMIWADNPKKSHPKKIERSMIKAGYQMASEEVKEMLFDRFIRGN